MNQEGENIQEDSQFEGHYANYFKVGYNAFEFVIDFGQCYNEHEEAKLHTRIITNSIYAKTLLETLWESIKRYEQSFGAIQGKEVNHLACGCEKDL
jgi:hypothetical protein